MDALEKLNEFGAVVTILVAIISALIWDRLRILAAHSKYTQALIETLEKSNEKHESLIKECAAIINENTKSQYVLAEAIRNKK